MCKILFFTCVFLNIFNILQASLKDEIILNLKKTENLSFNFKQSTNGRIEIGNCIIKYPKKIWCSYQKRKLLVSDGKILIIKNIINNQQYSYPLEKTPLKLILDKEYLINQIKFLNGQLVENKYLKFTLKNSQYEINIFFNSKTADLIGWQTEDIYQNLVITFISSLKYNNIINEKIFKLPKIN